MIFDRTQNDVDAALDLRNTKVKAFAELTVSEILTLERGMLTINTLNRIENKQQEIKNLFSNIAISVDIQNKDKAWDSTEIFDKADFERILNNLNILIKNFCVYSNTPDVPNVSYHFEDINSIEKILFDLEELYNKTLQSFRYCGTLYCGQ